MLQRSTVVLVAALMLLVPVMPAFAGDGVTTVSQSGVEVTNNEHHETEIALPAEGGPEEKGRWLGPIEGEAPAVNLALLPGGKLLYYSGVEANESKDGATDLHFMWEAAPIQGRSRVLNLSELTYTEDGVLAGPGAVTTPTPSDGGYLDVFCSGTSITPEGTAVAPGATTYHTIDEADDSTGSFSKAPVHGWNQSMLFPNDPVDDESDDWIRGPDMSVHRWYPSALQLPDGDTLVVSGIRALFWPQTYNTLLETFDSDAPDDGWEDIEPSFKVADGVTIPQRTLNALSESDNNMTDTGAAFVDETHQGIPNVPMYPRLHVVPDGPHKGKVLYGSNGDVWGPFGHHPNQELFSHFQTLDTQYGTWEFHARSNAGTRNLGTTVPLMEDATDDDAEAKFLSFGGTLQQSLQATATTEIIDASGDLITSTLTDPMEFPRWTVNGVLLPDGSVLSIGGSTYDNVLMHGSPNVAPLNIERFVPNEDQSGGEWERLPAMNSSRAYHSTALLLPDGRVIVGGHVPLPAFHHHQRTTLGNSQPRDSTFEIYEPPYLHHEDETRPEIQDPVADDLPRSNGEPIRLADFGESVELTVENLEKGIDSITLMRPGSATHQYTADQFGIELDHTVLQEDGDEKTIQVDIPTKSQLEVPPGHYLLFVNEDADDGIYPSEAAWLGLGEDVAGDTPDYQDLQG